MDQEDMKMDKRAPSLLISLLPLIALAGFLYYVVFVLGREPHPAIIAATFLAALISLVAYRTSWRSMEDAILDSSYTATHLILFFLSAMLLNSFWLRAGILPSLVYYGGLYLPPAFFLYVILAVFILVSFGTGSPWFTVAVLGPAAMTLGALLGQSQALTAGIILSGAYWGSRLSPLSLTNYMSATASGGRVSDHIRSSFATALPAIALVIGAIYYFGPQLETGAAGSRDFLASLPGHFTIHPLLLFFPLLFILLFVLRMSAIPVFFLGILTGSILIVFYQGEPFQNLWSIARVGSPDLSSPASSYFGILDKGGLTGQWWTVGLILSIMVFGGVMKASGMLDSLSRSLAGGARGRRTLGAMAVLGSFLTNLGTSDPYLSISLPASHLRGPLHEMDLDPKVLSRPLEDTGPVTSALVPWSMTGILMAALLGVEVWDYAPWAVYLWASPLLALIFSLLGLFTSGSDKKDKPAKKKYRDLESFTL